MKSISRVAEPGDICILLEPTEDEIADVRELQLSLQSLFGGHPHERVHLTCQRFELPDPARLTDVIHRLRSSLLPVQPIPIVAISFVQMESRFWGSRLLRWLIQGSSDLQRFGRLVEASLVTTGAFPHFRYTSGWEPTLVTALEEIPGLNPSDILDNIVFPQFLFTARQAVLSRIVGRRQFEILDTIQLSSQ